MYKSKIDTWTMIVLAGTVGTSAYASYQILLAQPASALCQLIPIAGLGVLLPLWILLDTRYLLTSDELRIHCGPLRWQIPIQDIIYISATRSLFASPALSLDRLRIDYRDGRMVMVSPRDKEPFIAAIKLLAMPRA
ncbi:PH domain-containing protein [Pandoraea captiosa]|nr:PH domain-containing protein [Pandoraea captiosa]